MAQNIKPKQRYLIHPGKFTLWLFIVSITLFFGGITSAYIVSRGIDKKQGLWNIIDLPQIFWYTTAVLLISSIMIQLGVWGARKGDFGRVRIASTLTFGLGILFLIGQVLAWKVLYNNDVRWGNGSADSYLYLLTLLHATHIIAGLIFLVVVMVKSYRNKYTTDNITGIENCATFWHYLGLLWLYLFIFLLVNHS